MTATFIKFTLELSQIESDFTRKMKILNVVIEVLGCFLVVQHLINLLNTYFAIYSIS